MKKLNMKLTHIALAVAALGVASAHAHTGSTPHVHSLPGLTAAGIPAANQIFISGASALSASAAAVAGSLCNTAGGGVLTTSSCGSSGVTVRCTSGNATSGFSGVPFAVVKRDTDGSFAGVGNVISETPITGWCDTTGNNTTLLIPPNAGLTDVDTNVWRGSANTGALSIPVPPPSSNPDGVTQTGGFAGQGFGIMVSDNMYLAMQAVQVADGRLPAGCAGLTPGQCQPSISKEEYTAIVDGGNFAYINSTALTGTANTINLCRRVETSGTQAASNVYFLNNSCAAANPTFGFKPPKKVVFPIDGGAGVVVASGGVSGNYEEFGGAFSIFEGSGTGDTRNCISRRNLGQDPNGTVDTDGFGTYAIGVVSLENPLATGRQYVKLDGISPNAIQVVLNSAADIAGGGAADGWAQDPTNRINTVRGLYDFAPELEMLWSNDAVLNPPANFVTAFGRIRAAFSDPALVSLNGVFQANTGPGTHAANPTRVHKGTRNGNFCTPQVLAE